MHFSSVDGAMKDLLNVMSKFLNAVGCPFGIVGADPSNMEPCPKPSTVSTAR